MNAPPESTNFEPRNRIIAGLALGVLVVEAATRSGALITARLAAEYNREVFALPGRVDTPSAFGTNALIRDGGAKLVACLEDILDGLGDVGRLMDAGRGRDVRPAAAEARTDGIESVPNARAVGHPPTAFDADQQAILTALDGEEETVESLAQRSGLTIPKVMSVLMALRLKGLVRELPGQRFAAARRR